MRVGAIGLLIGLFCSFAHGAIIGPEVSDVAIGPYPNPHYLVMRDTNLPCAQTFTCTQAGILSRVELQVRRNELVTHPVTVSVLPLLPSGAPNVTAIALAASTLTAAQVPIFDFNENAPYLSFDMSAANLLITPGMRLAVALTTTQPYPDLGAPAYIWTCSPYQASSGPYAGGDAWYRNSLSGVMERDGQRDWHIQTWVAVPEPTGAMLMFLAFPLLRRTRC